MVKTIYVNSDQSLPIVGRERTCLFHWLASLDKVMQNHIKASLQFQYKQLWKDSKYATTIDKVKIKYHVIRSWWLSSNATIEEGILGLYCVRYSNVDYQVEIFKNYH